MTKSDQRYERLVKNHLEEERQAWRFFRFELEKRWDLLYPDSRRPTTFIRLST